MADGQSQLQAAVDPREGLEGNPHRLRYPFLVQSVHLLWIAAAVASLLAAVVWRNLSSEKSGRWNGASTASVNNVMLRGHEDAIGLWLHIEGSGNRAAKRLAVIRGAEGEAAEILWTGERAQWPRRGMLLEKPRLGQTFCLLNAPTPDALSQLLQVARQHWQALEPRFCLEYERQTSVQNW